MVTYNSELLSGGRNTGCTPYRDIADENFHYHIRESNATDQEHLEAVKIDTSTGLVAFQGPLWAYDGVPRLEELGACFTDPDSAEINGDLVGSRTGDKLYITGSSIVGFGPVYDSVIIEFDKATLEVTDSWTTGVSTDRRAGGHSVMNDDGSLFVRCGDFDVEVPTGYIEVLNTTTGVYTYTSLASLGLANQIIGLTSSNHAACCFDGDDNFWFITGPVVLFGSYYNGKSTLRKATISAAGVITLQAAYEIDDDHYAFGLNSFGLSFGYRALWFNPTTGYLNAISTWRDGSLQDDNEGWYWEFDPSDGSVIRGPLNWTPGRRKGSHARYDVQRRTARDVIASFSLTNSLINLFTISTAAEETHLFSNFPVPPVDVLEGTAFHSTGSEIILLLDTDDGGGAGAVYQDILFQIEPDFTGTTVIGGAGMQVEPFGCLLTAQAFALEVRDLNSILELGPFRFVEQKESDETSMITTLVLGLTEVDIGEVTEVDMALIFAEVDMATLVDVLGDDVEIDMGEGVDSSDDFTLELLGNDDGSTYPGAPIEFKPEALEPIDDRGSVKQYSPLGYSYIYHRVRLKATEIDEKFAVKFVDISGQLTGRFM